MSSAVYVLAASRDNFDALVLGNSSRGLVLVHYWTAKAAPCLLLNPRLARLAEEYAGRFLLVMANTDELASIARREGVTSVPTVKFYLRGQVAHTIHGAEPDSTFRAALARFIAGPGELARQQALQAHAEGDTQRAIALLARIAVERPEDLDIAQDLAKLLTLSGQPGQALGLLESLPVEARRDPRLAPLLAHLELIEAAGAEPPGDDPADPARRLHDAALALIADRHQEAMEGLLTLCREAPRYRDDIGRRGLLALFSLLGAEHELTRRFRTRLARGN